MNVPVPGHRAARVGAPGTLGWGRVAAGPRHDIQPGDAVNQHVFDLRESAERQVVARQLHDLADQFAKGRIDLAYDEWTTPTRVSDPVNVVLDFTRNKHHASLVIDLRWEPPAD